MVVVLFSAFDYECFHSAMFLHQILEGLFNNHMYTFMVNVNLNMPQNMCSFMDSHDLLLEILFSFLFICVAIHALHAPEKAP